MKVALLSHEGGGISSVTHGLARCLSNRKVYTTIFTGTSKKAKVENVNAYLEIVRLPFPNFPPRSVWFQLRNFRALLTLSDNYDVIHGVSPYVSMINALFQKRAKTQFITSVHGTPQGAMKAFVESPISHWTCSDFGSNVLELPLNDFAIRRCIANSNHVVVCSYAALNELMTCIDFNLDKVSVIYNGVDFQEIESLEIDNDEKNNQFDFTIVFAGRLFWMKGVMFALKAFEILNKEFRNVELKIFGKGPLEGRIESFIAARGLEDNVLLGGHIPHKDLLAEIKKSDVIVIPSIYESQPMIALEAMACKKAVIVFDFPYAREIIVDKFNGVLADAYNVRDLSEKMHFLLSDDSLRFKLGQNAYRYVKQEHDWEVLVEKYLKIYRRVSDTS